MTESPFVKAEGPEPPDEGILLGEKHRETMAKLYTTISDQLTKQSMFSTETSTKISVADTHNESTYYREQLQPDRAEIERVLAKAYRNEMDLTHTRDELAQATNELNRVSNSLRLAETKLIRDYVLIGQLVGYLDSIEWGTHDEWTRSQSLRERAHEYVESFNTIAT